MIIRNIWAVGKNYPDHVVEMQKMTVGSESVSASSLATRPALPMIFLKAGSSASVNSTEIELPWWTEEVHHEVELALKISSRMTVLEAAVALDLTERKLQLQAKKTGSPWTAAKSFDGACAVSSFFQAEFTDLQDKTLRLTVNNKLVQEGHTSQMIFSCQEILDHLIERYPVCPGDLILTGTPAGVGPLNDGDVVRAEIEKEIVHVWKVIKQRKPDEQRNAKTNS